MKGMTGYGRATAACSECMVEAVLSSCNKKSFDLSLKISGTLTELEPYIRKAMREKFERGSFVVCLRVCQEQEASLMSLAQQRCKILQEMVGILGLNVSDNELFHALVLGDEFFAAGQGHEKQEKLVQLAMESFERALQELVRAREHEGSFLLQDLLTRAKKLLYIRDIILDKKGDIVGDLIERFRSVLSSYMTSFTIDDRLLKEVVLYADKMDIAEELSRIGHHIERFFSYLSDEKSVGKQLDFLLQELMREYNTLGAKATNIEISHLVVEAKTEIEKMREQVQNVE